MKIGDRCFVRGYIDEIRKDTVIIRNKGGYFGTDPGEVIVVNDAVHPNWIPCSERLPEEDVEVFVYLFDRPSPYIAWFREGCWFTEEFQVEKENYPKAWMPLPEPYREEGEE